MSEAGWYYAVDGQRMGPVALEHLRQLASQRRIGPGDLVWCQGMADWQPAGSIPGLMSAPPPPPREAYYDGGPWQGAPPSHGGNAPAMPYRGPGGQPVQYYGRAPVGQSYQGMAIAGFVLSFLFSLLGLIFSWIALSGMKRTGNNQGKGLATAGLVISIVMIALGCMCFGLAAPMRMR